MSLYQAYVTERRHPNGGVVEDEYGFATYHIFPEQRECYIDDIYVVPEQRLQYRASSYEDMIIDRVKDQCDKLTGTVDVTANGAESSVIGMIKQGYKLLSTNNNIISFIKEL